jgi:hypothetical protein
MAGSETSSRSSFSLPGRLGKLFVAKASAPRRRAACRRDGPLTVAIVPTHPTPRGAEGRACVGARARAGR